jgi:hypothetical protein
MMKVPTLKARRGGLIACVALLVACGSTVQQREVLGQPGLTTGVTSTATSGSNGSGAGTSSGTGLSTAGGTGSAGTGSTATGGAISGAAAGRLSSSSGGTTSSVLPGPSTAPGSPVQVGLLNLTGYSAGLSALGFAPVDTGDMKAQGDAIVSYINAHGGLLGHRIVPVYFTYDVASSSSAPYDTSLYSAACSTWAEDHHVIAGTWPGGLSDSVLAACMQKHNAGLVQLSVGGTTERVLKGFPLVTAPTWISMERAYRLLVRRLAAQQYFADGARVGLVRFDTPEMAYIQKSVIEPELKKVGVTLTDSVALNNPDSTSDISGSASQVQGAILKFRSDRVDHVIFEDFSRLAATEWLPSADSSHYTPRYAFTSDSGPAYLTENGNGASQLRNAIGIGWNPSELGGDTESPQNPLRKGAAETRCMKIMAAADQPMSNAGTRETALQQCEVLFDLQAIVTAGGDITAAAIARGINSVHGGVTSGKAFDITLHPGKHAGAAYFRDIYFDDGACACFRYRGQNQSAE